MDEAIRDLAATLGDEVAVVALGGYGRRLLTPASDVDLMVLHRRRRPDRVQGAAERLFYPFWDARIPLGHAVRTVGQCLAEAEDALEVACSLLDARVIAGDPSLGEELSRRLMGSLRRGSYRFADRLRQDAAGRHARHASCGTAVEPDLKEGAGGLRDVNAIGWLARVAGNGAVPGDRREVDAAEEFLVRLRSALRLLTGRKGDVLYREHQPDLAEALGFDATAGLDAADALMRTLFDHARRVARDLDDALDHSGVPAAPAAGTPPPLAEAATAGWDGDARRSFLGLLAGGAAGARVLGRMDLDGTLTALLPAWEAVRCRPQRDPYHRSPVDVHLLATARVTVEILAGDDRGDPLLGRSAEAVTDRDGLLLGAFLHDIGKRGEGRHVEAGAVAAGDLLERMGVPEPSREHALFLVREHLLLPEVATRRDLTDADLVLRVAAMVADPERLAMLHVLSVADAEATGPHAFTPWRLGLVRELVTRVGHVLERGEMDPERASELDDRRREIRALLGSGDPEEVDAYLDMLPTPYLLAVPAETAAAHHRLLAPPLARSEVRTVAEPAPRPGAWQVTVTALDRPGLLARIAGSLALSGLNVMSAQAFTTAGGVAVDLFDVVPAFAGEIDEERWRAVRHTLRRALDGRLSLEYRVREKRRHYPGPTAEVPTEVRVLGDVSADATVVEVETTDRIGLLFDLAGAFEELHLDVSLAKVATYGPRVVDAFYVRRQDGGKVDDPEHAREIERAIRSRLER